MWHVMMIVQIQETWDNCGRIIYKICLDYSCHLSLANNILFVECISFMMYFEWTKKVIKYIEYRYRNILSIFYALIIIQCYVKKHSRVNLYFIFVFLPFWHFYIVQKIDGLKIMICGIPLNDFSCFLVYYELFS